MPYKKHARVLYRLYSTALAFLSPVKPLFRVILRVLTGRDHRARGRVLPLNVPVGQAEQVTLSRELLAELIGRSTAVAAMHECMCRTIGGCRDYPRDLGCLILGREADSLHPGLGRPVDKPEALAIVDRALASGLTPMVIHMKSDGTLWSLDWRRMLTVCFCCPCHCLLREAVGSGQFPASGRFTGLPGAAVTVDSARCTGCGRCAAVCMTGALRSDGGLPAIDCKLCVACGRCALACGHGALSLGLSEPFDAEPVVREFERRTEKNSVFMK